MKLSDLAPNPRNPRKISPKKLEMLKKSIQELGNLDGVIYNQLTKRLVGAHQRQKIDPDAEITIDEEYLTPKIDGTTAIGSCLIEGVKFNFRRVAWDESKEMAANMAANRGAGDWDFPELTNWMVEIDDGQFDMDLSMFDSCERERLMVDPEKIKDEAQVEHEPEEYYQSIRVNFMNKAAVVAFSELISQPLDKNTKNVLFPDELIDDE